MITREASYQALFTLLQGLRTAGVLRTCDRRVRFLEDLSRTELPALFMAVDHQPQKQRPGMPAQHVLKARLYLYAENPDRHTSADAALNTLIDAVEAALAPTPGQQNQTLGGQVSHCWIDEAGPEIYPGALGQRAAAIIPVQMLVP